MTVVVPALSTHVRCSFMSAVHEAVRDSGLDQGLDLRTDASMDAVAPPPSTLIQCISATAVYREPSELRQTAILKLLIYASTPAPSRWGNQEGTVRPTLNSTILKNKFTAPERRPERQHLTIYNLYVDKRTAPNRILEKGNF